MKGIPKGVGKRVAKELFDTLKKEMGLNEETEEPKKDNLKRFLIVFW